MLINKEYSEQELDRYERMTAHTPRKGTGFSLFISTAILLRLLAKYAG